MNRSGCSLGLREDFEKFVQKYDNELFLKQVAERSDVEQEVLAAKLENYFGEMRFGFEFLSRFLPSGNPRILEVGAGLGLLSIYLHQKGYEVVALEPAEKSFGFFEAAKAVIWSSEVKNLPQRLDCGAEDLTPDIHGTFDFIFSINVMEHIEHLDKATKSIFSVMSDDGVSTHTCPNYLVPYEPHFAIPLVPGFPAVTKYLLPSAIKNNPDLWDTFNFISWFTVKRLAKKNGGKVCFEKGTMAETFLRLNHDPQFKSRHKGIIGIIALLMNSKWIAKLVAFLPPIVSTPMTFHYCKRDRKINKLQ